MFNKIFRFAKALFFHIGYGMPKSSTTEIKRRWDVCCKCEYLDTEKSQCLQCGCNIGLEKKFLNKLAWLDQKCPINKW